MTIPSNSPPPGKKKAATILPPKLSANFAPWAERSCGFSIIALTAESEYLKSADIPMHGLLCHCRRGEQKSGGKLTPGRATYRDGFVNQLVKERPHIRVAADDTEGNSSLGSFS